MIDPAIGFIIIAFVLICVVVLVRFERKSDTIEREKALKELRSREEHFLRYAKKYVENNGKYVVTPEAMGDLFKVYHPYQGLFGLDPGDKSVTFVSSLRVELIRAAGPWSSGLFETMGLKVLYDQERELYVIVSKEGSSEAAEHS